MVDERFVISARVVGAVVRDAPKLKKFMMSVLWSDESEVIIYRSFQDFKKFHRQLKKRFHAATLQKKDRVIPKFRAKFSKGGFRQGGSKRSVQRMKHLENYLEELLRCDQAVTVSTELRQFFTPKEVDLQPDFTKNSVMILMSDGLTDEGSNTQTQAGTITHPFVSQTYRCVGAYETKDTKNRPFKATVDEKLDVLIKDPAGWWLVENEEKRLAWFPAPFLELWDGEEDENEIHSGGVLYCAVKSYVTKEADEVSVPIGSLVEVLRKSNNGWWFIRFNAKAGYIPSMYLQPYNNPHASLYTLQRRLHSSTFDLTDRVGPRESLASIQSVSRPGSGSGAEGGPGTPSQLPRARSLDVLSETWTPSRAEAGEAGLDGRDRSLSNTSSDSNFSFSSGSESSGSREAGLGRSSPPAVSERSSPELSSPELSSPERSSPELSSPELSSAELSLPARPGSSSSSGSLGSKGSAGSSGVPKVPARPQTEEILNRCTTMTRKAALANKTRLQNRPQLIYSR